MFGCQSMFLRGLLKMSKFLLFSFVVTVVTLLIENTTITSDIWWLLGLGAIKILLLESPVPNWKAAFIFSIAFNIALSVITLFFNFFSDFFL